MIYSNTLHGYELRSVAISADKLALGLGSVTGTDLGMIRIFKKNGPSHPGPRWEEWKDIHLPVPPCDPQNPPHLLSLSWDGKFLTACTPNTGYFFAWDLFTSSEPSLISSGRVGQETQGTESLTGAFLFPDNKHILCSTCSTSGIEGRGCFTEPTKSTAYPPSHHPIRHVGLRIHHSAVSPNGNATAYLSKTGQIYIVPVVHIEGDDNVTSLPSVSPKERLQPSITAETAGRILFSPEGDKLIGIDRKGKVLILHFKKLLTESR